MESWFVYDQFKESYILTILDMILFHHNHVLIPLANIVPVGKEKVSIWELNETYKVKIISAKNVNVAENQKVYVRSSIYHGSEPVCDAVVTSQGANSESASWNEILEFNIPVNEIPRAAKLCFVIFGATDQVMNRR